MSSDNVSESSLEGQPGQGIVTCSLLRRGSELDSSSRLTWKVPEGGSGLSSSLWEVVQDKSECRSRDERSVAPLPT